MRLKKKAITDKEENAQKEAKEFAQKQYDAAALVREKYEEHQKAESKKGKRKSKSNETGSHKVKKVVKGANGPSISTTIVSGGGLKAQKSNVSVVMTDKSSFKRQKTNKRKEKFNIDTSDSQFQSINAKELLSTKENNNWQKSVQLSIDTKKVGVSNLLKSKVSPSKLQQMIYEKNGGTARNSPSKVNEFRIDS